MKTGRRLAVAALAVAAGPAVILLDWVGYAGVAWVRFGAAPGADSLPAGLLPQTRRIDWRILAEEPGRRVGAEVPPLPGGDVPLNPAHPLGGTQGGASRGGG